MKTIFDEEILENARDLIENGTLLFVNGDARKDDGGVRIIVESLCRLDEALKNYIISIKVFLDDTNALPELKKLLGPPGKGKSRISVVLEDESRKVEITLPTYYQLTLATIAEIKDLKGVRAVNEM